MIDATSYNVHYVKSSLTYPQIYGYVICKLLVIHRMLWITVDKSLWTGAAPAHARRLGPPPSGRAAGAAAAVLDIHLHPPIRKKFLK